MIEDTDEMVVITDISVEAAEFGLGRLFTEFPEVQIEIERVIPLQHSIMPLFWVTGADPEAVKRSLEADPLVDRVRVLTQKDDRALFELDWSPDIDHLITPLMEHRGDTLRAEGNAESWVFRIQFHDRESLRAFRTDCEEAGIVFELLRLYDPYPVEDDSLLTDEQRDALLTAYEGGYWDIPRGTSLAQIAKNIGISSQAVSERLRRGTKEVMATYVVPNLDEDEDGETD